MSIKTVVSAWEEKLLLLNHTKILIELAGQFVLCAGVLGAIQSLINARKIHSRGCQLGIQLQRLAITGCRFRELVCSAVGNS